MPKKIIVKVTYRGEVAFGETQRQVQRTVAMYFSKDWDQYYHETFYSKTEKKAALEELQRDLVLALDNIIEKDVMPVKADTAGRAACQVEMRDKFYGGMAANCYIYRVALDRNNPMAYQVIYYRQGDTEGHCQVISQEVWKQLKASVVEVGYDLSENYGEFQTTMADAVTRIEPRLAELSRHLYQTINQGDYVAFIRFFDSHISNARITQPLNFPSQKGTIINYDVLYQALLPDSYAHFQICLRDFETLLPRLEKLNSNFNAEIADKHIDENSQDYRDFIQYKDWFFAALKYLRAIKKT